MVTKRNITILLYHQIEPDLFSTHLEYLQTNYNVISLRQARTALIFSKKNNLPNRSLVITFDDGWRSNFSLFPILTKHNCNVTIFLPASFINTKRKIWNYILDESQQLMNNRLKEVSNCERVRILGQKYGYYQEKEYQERTLLNLSEIEKMKSYVDFQSHGMFHSVFTKCSETELRTELVESKRLLTDILQKEIYAIAYPYGRAGKREIEAARDAGYDIGRISNSPFLNRIDDDPMSLAAVGVKSGSTVEDLQRAIALAEIRTLFRVFSKPNTMR